MSTSGVMKREHAWWTPLAERAGVLTWLVASALVLAADAMWTVHARWQDFALGVTGLRQASLFGVALLVLVRPRWGFAVAIGASIVAAPFLLRPGLLGALAAFVLVTWAISRIRIGAPARLMLVLAVCGGFVLLRDHAPGWTHDALALRSLPEALLWSVLLIRSVMYQMEAGDLPEQRRGLLPYLGSFTLLPLTGAAYLQPIPYGQFLGSYDASRRIHNLAAGTGLLALSLGYRALYTHLCVPWVEEPLGRWAAGLGQGATLPDVDAALALILFFPALYLAIAGTIFHCVGGLRLLGFTLPSGFRMPFLSRDLFDFWKRWNHYYYDMMMLFFFPLLGWLRTRLPKAAAYAAAVFGVFLVGSVVLRDLLEPLTFQSPYYRHDVPVNVAKHVFMGVLTAAAAYLAVRGGRRREPSRGSRVLRIAATMLLVAAVHVAAAVAERARIAGGPPPDGPILRAPVHLAQVPPASPEPVLAQPITLMGDTRSAMLAPVGGGWRVAVAPEKGSALELAVGLVGVTPDPAASSREVCFQVTWRGRDQRTLYRDCAPVLIAGALWRDARVRLDGLAGQQGELWFTAELPGAPGPQPMAAAWGNPRLTRAPAERRPNIVLLLVDTLRADRLGAAGHAAARTPNIDRLARQSVRFRRANAVAPWTQPSVAALLTGLYPSETRAGWWEDHAGSLPPAGTPCAEDPFRALAPDGTPLAPPGPDGKSRAAFPPAPVRPIAPAGSTLAERLRAAGYHTAAFFASNPHLSPATGLARGFDEYVEYPGKTVRGGMVGAAAVARWLQVRRALGSDAPYFLFVHFMDPHLPLRKRAGGKVSELWDTGGFISGACHAHRDQILEHYDAEIEQVDAAIGAILDTLGADAPVAILTADHGEAFGEHGQYSHGHSLYQELLRVPLYIHRPGSPGADVDAPVSLVDLAPTILAAAGLPADPRDAGRDLLAGGAGRPVFAEFPFSGPERRAVIWRDHKLVAGYPPAFVGAGEHHVTAPPAVEIYDHRRDPLEQAPLVAEAAGDIRGELQRRLDEFVDARVPGLHLRCLPGESPAVVTVDADAPAAATQALSLEPDDRVAVDGTGRQVTASLSRGAAGEADSLVILLPPGARVDVRASVPLLAAPGPRDDRRRWSGALPELGLRDARPPQAPGTCTLWSVGAAGEAGAEAPAPLSERELELLRSLGYL